MRGAIPPLASSSSWRGAQLKKKKKAQDKFTLPLLYYLHTEREKKIYYGLLSGIHCNRFILY
jgi:hypothetical protein